MRHNCNSEVSKPKQHQEEPPSPKPPPMPQGRTPAPPITEDFSQGGLRVWSLEPLRGPAQQLMPGEQVSRLRKRLRPGRATYLSTVSQYGAQIATKKYKIKKHAKMGEIFTNHAIRWLTTPGSL